MISYNWNIKSLRKTNLDNLSGVVIEVYWDCVGTDDDDYTGIFSGFTIFKNVDPNNFIDFDNLTEEIVLSWVQPEVYSKYWDHVEAKIQEYINAKKNPVIDVTQLPWNPSANSDIVQGTQGPQTTNT